MVEVVREQRPGELARPAEEHSAFIRGVARAPQALRALPEAPNRFGVSGDARHSCVT